MDKKQLDHPPITYKDYGLGKKKRSICQTHRELYSILEKEEFEGKDQALKVLKEAYQYGIKMGKRLAEKK